MKAKVSGALGLTLVLLALTACGNTSDLLGIEKKAPDEFAVVRRAPLSVPPDYDLRPPRFGERPLPQLDPQRQAQTAVLGSTAARPVAPSAGEEGLLSALEIHQVDPDIRRKVDQESALLAVDERNFVERLMFWREPPPPGTAIDAEAERRRIQENEALGRPPTTGATPTIERTDTVRNRIF